MSSPSRSRPSSLARRLVLIGALAVGLAGLGGMAGVVRAADGDVIVLTATGVVDNVMAGYLEDGVRSAADAGAPGGRRPAQHARGQPRRHAADHQHVPRGPGAR